MLIRFDRIDQFREAHSVDVRVPSQVLRSIKTLDEREELEPFLRSILADPNDTPHGPAEIADIFTHKVTVGGKGGLAAFILKGKSYPTGGPDKQLVDGVLLIHFKHLSDARQRHIAPMQSR